MSAGQKAPSADAVTEAGASTPIDTWVRYTHLDKVYGYLPGIRRAAPAILGLDADEYGDRRSRLAARAREAARELIGEPEFATAAARLPFRSGQTVLALGDSVTDDLLSWFEILGHVLAGSGVRWINAGRSAHTTAMILRTWPGLLAGTRPDWVLCCLGGNDVTRLGTPPGKCQVSTAESVANLAELRRIGAQVPSWCWLSPVRVDEERVAASPTFGYGRSSWANADVDALTEAMCALSGPLVDLSEGDVDLEPDGVHPSLPGQQQIVRRVVAVLSALDPAPGPVDR